MLLFVVVAETSSLDLLADDVVAASASDSRLDWGSAFSIPSNDGDDDDDDDSDERAEGLVVEAVVAVVPP